MKKDLLIVVDEKQMGGVSILLEDMLNLGVFSDYNTDILVLHNNGDRLENIPNDVNIIYGSKYFTAVDLSIKEVLKSKTISLIISKIRLVLDMKTGFIKYRIRKERKKILNKKYDLEIAFKDGFTALFTIFGSSLKKIHWLHYEYGQNNPNKRYDKLFQTIIPKFDEIIAVSNGVKNEFIKCYNVCNVEVIPNIINEEKIKNMALEKATIKYDVDKLNLLLVGRLHPVKGYDRFLKVLKTLNNEGFKNKINVNIIGDGPSMEELVNFSKENNLSINFHGKMDNPYKEFKNSDLLVLPSLYEAFGLVVLESFILNTPVLATKTAAIKDIILHEENGLIVENSEDGIYEGLKKILENKEILQNLKNNIQHYNYDVEEKIQRIKTVVERCFNEKNM